LLPVEIYPIQDAIVLRARGSELLILADHVTALKKLKSAGDFSKYFLNEALVNRPARKLFEAWLRKDGSLWARIYKSVQTIESNPETASDQTQSKSVAVTESIREAAKDHKKPELKAKVPAKKDDKKEEKKTDTKPAVKAAAKPAAKPAVKPIAKPAAKSAAKPAPKEASRPASKPAPKKSTTK